MSRFNPDHKDTMDRIMAGQDAAVPGQMFGYPGYKVNGKLAVGLHEQGVIVKLGRDRANQVISQGVGHSFEPMPGRVWRDWVLLTGNFDQHTDLFAEAAQWVQQETG